MLLKIKAISLQRNHALCPTAPQPQRTQTQQLYSHAKCRKVSEVGAKTIARPSGLLGGGLVALLGGVFTLYTPENTGSSAKTASLQPSLLAASCQSCWQFGDRLYPFAADS